MTRYLQLYLFWLLWVSLVSAFISIFLSLFASLLVYISKGFQSLNKEVFQALFDIVSFAFPIAFSLSFIIALLLVFKALFRHEFKGFTLELYNCSNEVLDKPLLSEITLLWRKWLFVTLWSILIFLVLVMGLSKLIFGEVPLEYLNGISVYLLVVSLGGLVFVLGINRCKKVGIKDA